MTGRIYLRLASGSICSNLCPPPSMDRIWLDPKLPTSLFSHLAAGWLLKDLHWPFGDPEYQVAPLRCCQLIWHARFSLQGNHLSISVEGGGVGTFPVNSEHRKVWWRREFWDRRVLSGPAHQHPSLRMPPGSSWKASQHFPKLLIILQKVWVPREWDCKIDNQQGPTL